MTKQRKGGKGRDLKVSVKDDAVLALIARYRLQIVADADEQARWLDQLDTTEARKVAKRILELSAGGASTEQSEPVERFARRVLAAC